MPEDKDAKTKENTQNKNNSKNNAALKGISQDLLNKVSAKPTTHHLWKFYQKLIADRIDVSIWTQTVVIFTVSVMVLTLESSSAMSF